MRIFVFIAFLFVVAAAAAFTVVNATPATLNYYFGTIEVPLSLMLVISLALGAVLGVLVCSTRLIRLNRENARLRKEARLAEKEVMNLRNLPIRDSR